MKTTLLFLSLLAVIIGFASPPQVAHAQAKGYWPIMQPVTIDTGTGGGRLFSYGDVVTLAGIDSVNLYYETQSATNVRILLAALPVTMSVAAADTVKDTVYVKTIITTGPAVVGITWQEMKQAFGGAVPPIFKPYIWIDREGTTIASGKKAAMSAREFVRPD